MSYDPKITFSSILPGSEQVELRQETPHVSVKLSGIRNSDVTSLIDTLPNVNGAFLGYTVNATNEGIEMEGRFADPTAARGFVNVAIKATDLPAATTREKLEREIKAFRQDDLQVA